MSKDMLKVWEDYIQIGFAISRINQVLLYIGEWCESYDLTDYADEVYDYVNKLMNYSTYTNQEYAEMLSDLFDCISNIYDNELVPSAMYCFVDTLDAIDVLIGIVSNL